jgi:hypothetical protein
VGGRVGQQHSLAEDEAQRLQLALDILRQDAEGRVDPRRGDARVVEERDDVVVAADEPAIGRRVPDDRRLIPLLLVDRIRVRLNRRLAEVDRGCHGQPFDAMQLSVD